MWSLPSINIYYGPSIVQVFYTRWPSHKLLRGCPYPSDESSSRQPFFSSSLWNEIIYTNSHDTIDEFQLKAKCCVFMIWNWFVLMLLFSILFNLFTKFLLEYFVKGIARMRKTKPRAQSMQSDMKRRIYKWIIITLIKSIQLNAYRVGNIEMTRVARQNFM